MDVFPSYELVKPRVSYVGYLCYFTLSFTFNANSKLSLLQLPFSTMSSFEGIHL